MKEKPTVTDHARRKRVVSGARPDGRRRTKGLGPKCCMEDDMIVNEKDGSGNNELAQMLGSVATWERGGSVPCEKGDILASIDKRFPVMDGPTSTVALRRAVQSVADSKLVARSLKARKGVAVLPIKVDEHVIKANGESVSFHVGPRGVYSEPRGHELTAEIDDKYNEVYAALDPADIVGALSDFIQKAGGVPMNSAGGMYYLSPADTEVWRKAAKALEHYGWKVYAIPFMRDAENISMVVDYVVRSIAKEIQAIDQELHGDKADKLRESTVTRRHAELSNLRKKAASYERLLGVSLDKLRDACNAAATEAGAAAILEGLL